MLSLCATVKIGWSAVYGGWVVCQTMSFELLAQWSSGRHPDERSVIWWCCDSVQFFYSYFAILIRVVSVVVVLPSSLFISANRCDIRLFIMQIYNQRHGSNYFRQEAYVFRHVFCLCVFLFVCEQDNNSVSWKWISRNIIWWWIWHLEQLFCISSFRVCYLAFKLTKELSLSLSVSKNCKGLKAMRIIFQMQEVTPDHSITDRCGAFDKIGY